MKPEVKTKLGKLKDRIKDRLFKKVKTKTVVKQQLEGKTARHFHKLEKLAKNKKGDLFKHPEKYTCIDGKIYVENT